MLVYNPTNRMASCVFGRVFSRCLVVCPVGVWLCVSVFGYVFLLSIHPIDLMP